MLSAGDGGERSTPEAVAGHLKRALGTFQQPGGGPDVNSIEGLVALELGLERILNMVRAERSERLQRAQEVRVLGHSQNARLRAARLCPIIVHVCVCWGHRSSARSTPRRKQSHCVSFVKMLQRRPSCYHAGTFASAGPAANTRAYCAVRSAGKTSSLRLMCTRDYLFTEQRPPTPLKALW